MRTIDEYKLDLIRLNLELIEENERDVAEIQRRLEEDENKGNLKYEMSNLNRRVALTERINKAVNKTDRKWIFGRD